MSAVQLRDMNGHVWEVPTVHQAFEAAKENWDIWKISWYDADGFRVRLVRHIIEESDKKPGKVQYFNLWSYEPIDISNGG